MIITAKVHNTGETNEVYIATDNNPKDITIPSKVGGKGSLVNGGELLFLALATCFCNDIYREGAKRKMQINAVEVDVTGEFGGEGDPGFNIQYDAKVSANASEEEIRDLITYVDKIAEVHNTLRGGTQVTLRKSSLLQA